MTRVVRARDIVIRPADEHDASAVANFECSTGPWYEEDVERYVRNHAHRRAMATDYRLLLALERGRLVGCGAHHREDLVEDDGTALSAARLQVLAIALPEQGARLDDGARFSDALLQTVMRDAMAVRGVDVLTAIVAQDNLRSMALCERNGLRSQVRFNARHVRLTGRYTRR